MYHMHEPPLPTATPPGHFLLLHDPQGVPYLHMAISEAAYNVSKVAAQEAAAAGAGPGPAGGDSRALAREAAAAAAWMQGTYEDVMGKVRWGVGKVAWSMVG